MKRSEFMLHASIAIMAQLMAKSAHENEFMEKKLEIWGDLEDLAEISLFGASALADQMASELE